MTKFYNGINHQSCIFTGSVESSELASLSSISQNKHASFDDKMIEKFNGILACGPLQANRVLGYKFFYLNQSNGLLASPQCRLAHLEIP